MLHQWSIQGPIDSLQDQHFFCSVDTHIALWLPAAVYIALWSCNMANIALSNNIAMEYNYIMHTRNAWHLLHSALGRFTPHIPHVHDT